MASKHQHMWRATLLPLGFLSFLLIPVPSVLLDIGLCANFTLSLTLVFWVFSLKNTYAAKLFPSLFLYLCLFRVGLNLASTRWIISSGWASPMIFSMGKFFSLGNLSAGLAACSLLLLVNFIVIAKGAERVAEVRARFILEAMPGKQMALDADLASGRISKFEGDIKKKDLFEESDFFSSMEGVFRFVKGDSIVSCFLLVVNSIGVFFLPQGSELACQDFWSSVIGDALVSQIPALLSSCAAATLISKVGREESLIEHLWEFYQEIRNYFLIVASCLCPLLLVPGISKGPLFVFITSLVIGHRRPKLTNDQFPLFKEEREICWLAPRYYQLEQLQNLYATAQKTIFNELAISLPDASILRGTKEFLVLRLGKEDFIINEFSISYVLSLLRSFVCEYIDGNLIRELLGEAQKNFSIVIDDVIPKKISENSLVFLIRSLVKERISLRLFPKILEAISLYGVPGEDHDALSKKIRKYLGKSIGKNLWNQEETLQVITIDGHVEKMIGSSYTKSNPVMCDKMIREVKEILQNTSYEDFRAIVTGCELRSEVRKIIEPHFPDLLVLSHNELPEEIPVTLLGSVSDDVLIV
ncbi:FHIPEP family protein [Chlamydia ibidis]|uniref:FHIPEP family protein n=1 Tax=Chlamydia ibidis TaxID=1405396 RepID=S7J5T3_9CHLA|nr:FHIPEP family protein [Chlamydia ibidis]